MPAGLVDLQVVLKAKDEASKVMGKVGGAGAKAGTAIRDNWKGATVALGVAAGALEGLSRAQQENTQAVGRLSRVMGLQEDQVRDLAREMSNVTFPIEDVLSLMEQGNALGLESEEALTEYAKFWDMVGDATGGAGPELAKTGVALKAVGIEIGNESEALAAFGFITDNTSLSVGEFLSFIEKAAPDIKALGLSVDDTAALIAAMEGELGLAGRTAKSEFQAAVVASGGSLEETLSILGLTTDQLAEYKALVSDSSTVIQGNAAVFAESFTPLQRFQHQIGELVFGHADLIKKAAGLAPLLIAVGPIAAIASGAFGLMSGAASIAAGAFAATGVAARAAWLAITGPIGLAVIAIGALVAAGVLIWRNWERIKEVFETVVNFIFRLYNSKLGWLLPYGPLVKAILFIKDNWRDVWESIESVTKRVIGSITDVVKGGVNTMLGLINFFIRTWNNLDLTFPGLRILGRQVIPRISVGTPDIPEIPFLKHGGVVPGAPGEPRLVMAHGGEEYLGVNGERAGRGGGTITVVNHLHGDVLGIEDVQRFMLTTVRDALRRGGFEGLLAT